MIQRLQTIWLSFVILLSGLLFIGKIVQFTTDAGINYYLLVSGIFRNDGSNSAFIISTIPVLILSILIPILAFIDILLFKNRKAQLRITTGIIVLSVGLTGSIIWNSLNIARDFDAKFLPGFRSVIPLLIIIFALLAYRGVKKDEDLVRSYDRLR